MDKSKVARFLWPTVYSSLDANSYLKYAVLMFPENVIFYI